MNQSVQTITKEAQMIVGQVGGNLKIRFILESFRG